jgi:5-methylcytosine-specific restriction endonuclease McrA
MSRQELPKWVRTALRRRQRHTCQWCGTTAARAVLEIDHIHPVSKGGTNEFSNLQLLCRRCNRRKGDRPNLTREQRLQRRVLLQN